MPLEGCDFSEWQTGVNWGQYAEQHQFAWIRGAYGLYHCDLYGPAHRALARSVGVAVAHYGFVLPDQSSALLQAQAHNESFGPRLDGEPVACDVEVDHPQLIPWVKDWADWFLQADGKPPVMYLNLDFLQRYDWQPLVDLGCGLWVAHPDNNAQVTETIDPWPFAMAKQYVDAGQAFGVSDPVDRDVFFGDLEQFRLYGRGTKREAGASDSSS